MLLNGHVFTVPNGTRGFDVNEIIRPSVAAAFHEHGYRFCLRYVRRDPPNKKALTHQEATGLLDAGLGLMIVQYVESEKSWEPTVDKGKAYGETAASECEQIGVPPAVTVWCDLEGVAVGTPAEQVVDYCNAWHSAVAGAGYVPGLYVGFHAGLNRTQLYKSLRFSHYWGAYNLDQDQEPSVRGLQMKQGLPKPVDIPHGGNADFQTDRVRKDALGGLPTLLGPDGWLGDA
jgi:hypothetical protein